MDQKKLFSFNVSQEQLSNYESEKQLYEKPESVAYMAEINKEILKEKLIYTNPLKLKNYKVLDVIYKKKDSLIIRISNNKDLYIVLKFLYKKTGDKEINIKALKNNIKYEYFILNYLKNINCNEQHFTHVLSIQKIKNNFVKGYLIGMKVIAPYFIYYH